MSDELSEVHESYVDGVEGDELEHKPKAFSFNARKVFLTYSQCPLLKDELLRELQLLHGDLLRSYIIGRERHSDGNYHLHVILGFTGRFQTKRQRYWDIESNGSTYHPNIRTIKKGLSGCIEYCMKDGDFIQDKMEMFKDSWNFCKRKADHEAWREYKSSQLLKSPFPFILPDGTEVMEPKDSDKKCNYWIIGKPDLGKTYWVENTFADRKIYKLAADDDTYPFDSYDGEQIIIADDHFPKRELIISVSNLYLTQTRVYGKTRYRCKFWPRRLRRIMIVLSNGYPCYYNEPWFTSRFVKLEMPGAVPRFARTS